MNVMPDNPAFMALSTRNAALGTGNDNAKYFYEEVSPFAGFLKINNEGFHTLHQLLPPGRNILFASRDKVVETNKWKLMVGIEGLQFVHSSRKTVIKKNVELIPLEIKHITGMAVMAALTKPGPFDIRLFRYFFK